MHESRKRKKSQRGEQTNKQVGTLTPVFEARWVKNRVTVTGVNPHSWHRCTIHITICGSLCLGDKLTLGLFCVFTELCCSDGSGFWWEGWRSSNGCDAGTNGMYRWVHLTGWLYCMFTVLSWEKNEKNFCCKYSSGLQVTAENNYWKITNTSLRLLQCCHLVAQ